MKHRQEQNMRKQKKKKTSGMIMKGIQDGKVRKQKKNKFSVVKGKAHFAGEQTNSPTKLLKNKKKRPQPEADRHSESSAKKQIKNRKKVMERGRAPYGVGQVENGSSNKLTKKRKRSKESQNRHVLKENNLKNHCAKDSASPASKKFKEDNRTGLTRKQKRNRKKNNSKKNKYKHLALNKSSDPEVDKKTSPVNSESVFQINPFAEILKPSTKRKGSSTEKPESAAQKIAGKDKTKSKKLVSASQTPLTSDTKRKKKRKLKDSRKTDDFDSVAESWDSYDSDDDGNAQEIIDHEHRASHHETRTTGSRDSSGTVSKTTQKEIPPKKPKMVSAVDKAREKLNAARFRYLNEQLYTSKGSEALTMFQEDPEAFHVYHQGFQQQVAQWPVNPLDVIIKQLGKTLSRSSVVADFGCGEARLAESLPHNLVHSFDLVSTKPCVTACDIAKVPLDNSCVDVAVFCLSLMGTNLSAYLCEANRVLHKGGLLKVAEVVSRFYNISRFVQNVEAIGFKLQKKIFLDKMFMLFTFRKVKEASRKLAPRIQLKACYYKRR